jgi:hypothetical protein
MQSTLTYWGASLEVRGTGDSFCYVSENRLVPWLLHLNLAISLGLSHCILKGDSMIVALALQLPDITQEWRIGSTISEIFFAIPASSCWEARNVNRSANLLVYMRSYLCFYFLFCV